jgi:hypothetical protein
MGYSFGCTSLLKLRGLAKASSTNPPEPLNDLLDAHYENYAKQKLKNGRGKTRLLLSMKPCKGYALAAGKEIEINPVKQAGDALPQQIYS